MMHMDAYVTPSNDIDYTLLYKSYRTYLTDHIGSISHHITPLVIYSLGGGHKHTHMYVCMYVCMHAMHVCMYACMHVCMYACMNVCMYAFYKAVELSVHPSIHSSALFLTQLCHHKGSQSLLLQVYTSHCLST